VKERIYDAAHNVEMLPEGCPTCGEGFRLLLVQYRDGRVIDQQTLSGDIARTVLASVPHWSGRPRA
jgi:hypothetical protein